MKNQTFEKTCTYLEMKYPSLFIGKEIVAHEMYIEVDTLNSRITSKIGLPPYIKLGDVPNSKFVVTLYDLAYYLSADTVGHLSEDQRREFIYKYLIKKYPRISISKKDFSKELDGICENTMGTYIKKKVVPKPKRQEAMNSKMRFHSDEIADFYSVVIQTM